MENSESSRTTPSNQSLFPLETCPQVSDEAFNLFHSIDRHLFARLIRQLGRDPAESVQIMALWMWLERESSDSNLIKRMLSLPPSLVNELADETAACLKCAESDDFRSGDWKISLLPELLRSPGIGLRFFHDNRIAVLRGVSKIISTVCVRAFDDILRLAAEGGGNDGPAAGVPVPVPVPFLGSGMQVPNSSYVLGESSKEGEQRVERGGVGVAPPIMFHPYLDAPFGLIRMPPPPHVLPPGGAHRPPPANAVGLPIHMAPAAGFPAFDLAAQRQILSNELGEMLSRNMTINNETASDPIAGGQEQEVPPDDRTIFLTFSKGYPTSGEEIREFFTKRFGDFIEDLIMQEVGEDEQVLYARMVAKTAAVIEGIVGGNKAKYSINGKHVWARKYVKKPQSKSPTRGDTP